MTAWSPLRWSDAYLGPLSNPTSPVPNFDPAAARYIRTIADEDTLTGTVGTKLTTSIQVKVLDITLRPVMNVAVTFTVKSGGGRFDNGSETITAITDYNGIATAGFTLGKCTGVCVDGDNKPIALPGFMPGNPVIKWKVGGTNAWQLSENIIDAALPSGQHHSAPVLAYAFPDEPKMIIKAFGDNASALPDTSAGSLRAVVADQWGNPVSDVDMTFVALAVESLSPGVMLPITGFRNIEFFGNGTCADPYPLYNACPSLSELTIKTEYFGSLVETMLGNTVATKYTVSAYAAAYPAVPAKQFTLTTPGQRAACVNNDDNYACQEAEGRYIPPTLFLRHLFSQSDDGITTSAAKAGVELADALTPELFLLSEDYEMVPYVHNNHTYYRIKTTGIVRAEPVTNGTVNFIPETGNGTVTGVTSLGSGKYAATYKTGLVPMKNTILARGQATVSIPKVGYALDDNGYAVPRTMGYGSSLPMLDFSLESGQNGLFFTDDIYFVFDNGEKVYFEPYGVDIEVTQPQFAPVDANGLLQEDLRIEYTINPANYRASGAQVVIYEKEPSTGRLLYSVDVKGETAGQGFVTLARGFTFDPERQYVARVELNRGTRAEIVSGEVPINIAQLSIDFVVCESPCTFGVKENLVFADGIRDTKANVLVQAKTGSVDFTKLKTNVQTDNGSLNFISLRGRS